MGKLKIQELKRRDFYQWELTNPELTIHSDIKITFKGTYYLILLLLLLKDWNYITHPIDE